MAQQESYARQKADSEGSEVMSPGRLFQTLGPQQQMTGPESDST